MDKSTSVTFTATVTGGSGSPPTGKVTFTTYVYWLNGTNVASPPSTVTSSVTLSQGTATYTTTFPKQGPTVVNVQYPGDSNFAASMANYTLWADTYFFQQTDSSSGQKKCYEIAGMIYGIHLTYVYGPGSCNLTTYPLSDCWYSWQQSYDGNWYYVYRHWAVGSSCPESQCCCGGGSNFGDCGSSYQPSYAKGSNCASLFPGFWGSPMWVGCCAVPNTPYQPNYNVNLP